MSVRSENRETINLIRFEEDLDCDCAAELSAMLLTALASGKETLLDVSCASSIDVTILQLLWAAAQEAKRTGATFKVVGDIPQSIDCVVRSAGFDGFPVVIGPEQQATGQGSTTSEYADGR